MYRKTVEKTLIHLFFIAAKDNAEYSLMFLKFSRHVKATLNEGMRSLTIL